MSSPFIIIDEIENAISAVETKVDTIDGIVDTINSNVTSILNNTKTNNTASKTGVLSAKSAYVISLLENSTYGLNAINKKNLVNALLSDSPSMNKWALRQSGLGAAINEAFNLNNSTLAGLSTAANIAANSTAVSAIASSKDAVNVCKYNESLLAKLYSYVDDAELILAAGLGYLKYSVGNTVSLTYAGNATTFRVVHKNYKTTNKIVLMAEQPLTTLAWNSAGNNNYSSSSIRTYLTGTVLGNFSEEIQSAIATTSVACHDYTTAKTCSDKIWLPSFAEVGLGTNTYAPVEGTVWSYFSTDATNRRKKSSAWWLRTPYTYNSSYAWYVGTDGSSNGNYVTNSNGVVPAFEI